MDVVHVYERSRHLHVLHPATSAYLDDYEAFNETVEALQEVARRDFSGEGYQLADVTYVLELDMKFGGQLNVKRVSSPLLRIGSEADVIALRRAFEHEYSDAYSPLGLNPEAGIEIHNFVVRGRVEQVRPSSSATRSSAKTRAAHGSARAPRTGSKSGPYPRPCSTRT